MSDMKHTPGPWHACHDGKCVCGMVWGDDDVIATVTRGEWGDEYPALREGENGHLEPYIARESYGAVSIEVAEANARLIAAAPELLEALGRLFAMGINTELRDICGSEWVDDARAAITKATRSPTQ